MSDAVPAHCRHCRTPVESGQGFCSRCGASTTVATEGVDLLRDRLERVFGEELVIEREIGRGGMGAVFVAFDPALQRRVAVKALLPAVESDPVMSARFLREARISAALQHPHIVTVFGVRSGDGVRAIVMQYIEGRGLDKVLAEMPSMPVPSVATILAEVAAALQHAHERGVIHRDIKPANVLLGYDGRAVVTDFGIARQFGATRITEEGLIMGTLPYLSPEAATGGEATAASDQYSLGVVAFEMLAGRRPFTGTAQQLLWAHANLPPPSLAEARPDLPPAVVEAVHRMLAKAPGARWSHVGEAEHVFRELVSDCNAVTRQLSRLSKAGSPVPSTVRHAGAVPAAVPAPADPTHHSPFRKALAPSAIVFLLVAAVSGVWIVRHQPAREQATQVSSPPSDTQPTAQQLTSVARAPVNMPPGVATDPALLQATPGMRKDSVQPGVVVPPADSAAIPPSSVKPIPPPPGEPPKSAARAEAVIAAPKPAAADVADARRLGNEFVTRINQRRWRELETLPGTGGDAAARAALIRLVRGTGDLAAGFNRVPSMPVMTAEGFDSEFILDLEVTTGGRVKNTLYAIVVGARRDESGWRLAGWRVEGVP